MIQQWKLDIDGEKGAQISIAAKKALTQWWPQFITMASKQSTNYINFLVSCYYVLCYVTDKIKNGIVFSDGFDLT